MPINFNKTPYYDDFSEDSHFMRLLFQPGRAVQARELTQIQSLLQNQIDSIGRHIFQNGSTVVGGKINYDKTNVKWLAIQPTDGSGNRIFINQIVPGQRIRRLLSVDDSNLAVDAEIVGVVPAEKGSPDTLFIKFNGSTGGDESSFGAAQDLIIFDPESGEVRYKVKTLVVDSYAKAQHIGTSSWLTVEPGIYYWNGMFLKSQGGTVRLSKYGNVSTYRVGFFVEESVVTDDPRTLDPASDTTNYFAPGADRYKVQLTLARVGDGLTFNDVGTDYQKVDNFIEICRIDSGTLLRAPGDKTLYNVLRDRLADRTFETSGNFVARPYNLSLENITTDAASEMRAHLSDGVAYVRGYRRGLDEHNTLRILKGRDSAAETVTVDNKYGDNFVVVYDGTADNEKANGIFTIGSGAGQTPITAVANGFRGEAVSVHCVPHSKVKDYSLLDANTWNSTLVATARPMQMSYNKDATDVGRGSCYNLWLADVKTSSVSGNTTVANIITGVDAAHDTGDTAYTFGATSHGIIAGDRISVSGSTVSGDWDIDNVLVKGTPTTTEIKVLGNFGSGTALTGGVLTLTRTTGNTNPQRTIVLDPNKSAAWNDSYVGATISVDGGAAKTIIEYVGANTDASSLWDAEPNPLPSTHSGLVIVDSDFDAIPIYGSTYTINLGMRQARSVVYNSNKDATGAELYPATVNKAWNIDPISGVDNKGESSKVASTLYGGRIDGDCKFNIYGEGGHDALIFPLGPDAIKRTVNDGNLDTGFNSNSVIYYTEYMRDTGAGTFVLPQSGRYKFCSQPSIYPYTNVGNITDLIQIRENFILVNETTSEVITNNITGINIAAGTGIAAAATVTGPTFVAGHNYILIAPAKASFVKPAMKKLVVANTTGVQSAAVADYYTDLLVGQLHVNSPSDITQRISLKTPDAFKIQKIIHKFRNDSPANANEDVANADLVVTDRFNFNDGQKDMYYDNAFITLKESAETPTGNLFVCFDYFQRTEEDGTTLNTNAPSFFSVDSYQTTTDLTFDSYIGGPGFAVGDRVKANSGAVGYVVEFANTNDTTAAKMQLEGVTGTFVLGDVVTAFYSGSGNKYANVVSVTEAQLSYPEIPTYTSSTGQKYNLKNMIDFRPYVSTSGRISDTIQDSMMMPIPSGTALRTGKDGVNVPRLVSSHGVESYLGRIDKLILTKDGKYTTIKGISGKDKRPPKDLPANEALTLFTINIPAYTNDLSKVTHERSVAVRHTMRDIGRLAQRVKNLEYYVSLNSLEQAARDVDVTFADGTERFKNGILTDNFTGFSAINAEETKAALGKGVLRPISRLPGIGNYNFNFSRSESDSVVDIASSDVILSDDGEISGRVITLGYTTEAFIQQPDACVVESVNPFDLQNYTGTLQLFPDF
ncbi:MAG TPA: DUF4815 domain-containing protein, partial [Flavobacteriales bacterium]|nr:DUF4815 domain-containing protein [Flavobacteriales bacterium]